MIISAKKATLKELQEDYSISDMCDLIEMITVESHNEAAWRQYSESKNGN